MGIRFPGVSIGRVTEGAPVWPLSVLFLLNAVESVDSAAFFVLIPEIKDHFGLSSDAVLSVVALLTPVAILVGLPLAHFADRLRRTKIAAGGATVWGGFAALTGLAPNVATFVVARAGAGIGKSVNTPTHHSLLSDYYPVDVRGKVFAAYWGSQSLGNMLGPLLAGILAVSLSWRAPFVAVTLITAVAVLLALTLREPVRGAHERRAAGATEADVDVEEEPPRFDEAWRLIYSVATLRRLYFSLPLIAGSVIGLQSVLALFYEEVYDVDELGRGVLFATNELFVLAGLLLGGSLAQRTMRRDPSAALRLLAYTAVGVSGGIALIALSPNLPLAIAAGWLQVGVGALLSPAISAILSLTVPPRARSLGFASLAVWALPGLIVLPVIGAVGDAHGFRVALLLLIPLYLGGGFLISTARGSVNRDIENNRRWALANARARAERIRFRQAVDSGAVDLTSFNLLEARDIHVSYGPLQVLFGVDLAVPRGGRVALLGTNGAGKSTLLKVISGLLTPDPGTGGTIWFDNEDVTYFLPEDRAELGMVHIGGGRATFPSLSVEENLRMGGYPHLRHPDLVAARIDDALGFFPVLRHRLRQPAGTLSGGEQQMLALGRALVAGPRLLIIDELSLGLAPIVMQEILAMVDDVARRGVTMLIVEQSLNVALTVTDFAYFLEKGEVRFSGPTGELLERGDLVRSVFFGSRPRTGV